MEENESIPIKYPDIRLNKHCQLKEGMDTLYSPDAGENAAVKAVEEELEDAVARYAEDNLLVARVKTSFTSFTPMMISSVRFS